MTGICFVAIDCTDFAKDLVRELFDRSRRFGSLKILCILGSYIFYYEWSLQVVNRFF